MVPKIGILAGQGVRRQLQRSAEHWTMFFELGPTGAQPSG